MRSVVRPRTPETLFWVRAKPNDKLVINEESENVGGSAGVNMH